MDYTSPLDRRAIINALFDLLVSGCNASFTCGTTAGSPVLSNVSSFTNLRLGAPVSGPGIPGGASLTEIAALDPANSQVTLDSPVAAGGASVPLFCGFQTVGRRLKPWSQVVGLPAMFVRHIGGEYLYRHATSAATITTPGGLPPYIYIDAQIWIYSVTGADAIPEDAVDALIDIVEAAVRPRPIGSVQTLGGLVRDCWLDGKYTVDPGDLDGQAKAVIPVRMLVPGVSPPGVARP